MNRSFRPDDIEGCYCERPAAEWDVLVLGGARWLHLMHTREGIRRWLRENRPNDGPLTWDREELPRWHAGHSADRAVYVVRRGGWARPAAGWVMRTPRDA